MKRNIIFIILTHYSLGVMSQSWVSGTQKLYTNPDTTKVGIGITSPTERLHINNGALKIGNSSAAADRQKNLLKFGDGSYVQLGEWEADDELSFKATKYNFTNGNVGIGVTNPLYKLDLNVKMFLRALDFTDGWGRSYLMWEAHKLMMGVPVNAHAHTLVELFPGGCSQEPLYSQLTMYTALNANSHEARIQFNTITNCWINTPANVGIGTTNPQYKLDVVGTIRAREILVNTSGADYVFADDYRLLPLQEVKTFVETNRHLPDIPSAARMQEDGLSVGEMQTLLLQKVEELTLYILQQEERIRELENNQK